MKKYLIFEKETSLTEETIKELLIDWYFGNTIEDASGNTLDWYIPCLIITQDNFHTFKQLLGDMVGQQEFEILEVINLLKFNSCFYRHS